MLGLFYRFDRRIKKSESVTLGLRKGSLREKSEYQYKKYRFKAARKIICLFFCAFTAVKVHREDKNHTNKKSLKDLLP